jgi:hypothetical protein
LVSPALARCLFTILATTSFSRPLYRPSFSIFFSIFLYSRSLLGLTPRGMWRSSQLAVELDGEESRCQREETNKYPFNVINASPDTLSSSRVRCLGDSGKITSSVGRTRALIKWPPAVLPSRFPKTTRAWIFGFPSLDVTSPISERPSTWS